MYILFISPHTEKVIGFFSCYMEIGDTEKLCVSAQARVTDWGRRLPYVHLQGQDSEEVITATTAK